MTLRRKVTIHVGVAVALAAFASVLLFFHAVSPEHIAMSAAAVAGIVTVVASVVAALKSVSTDKKADVITTQAIEITQLVDGRYGKVLEKLADVSTRLAAVTGSRDDAASAAQARTAADEQAARVDASRTAG